MFGKKSIYPPLLFSCLLIAASAAGQQSSKSKSKSKLYEKDGENKTVRVLNCSSLNSRSTDYSPTYYQNGIVYVSSRQKSGPQDKRTGETFFELYFAPFDPNGQPSSPEKFSLEINSALHEGPVTFSRDWQTMYFTRNNTRRGVPKADGKGIVRLKIYEAKRGPQDWEGVHELPFNSDDYSCMHPTLSADGSELYFASDMPGGYGGFDLYVSRRAADGTWAKPENLGPTINTPKSEVFPFIHASGTLFFSSNGHYSLGGLDMFFADKTDDGTDYEVVNMGEPFNSAKDDLGIILNDDATGGFFSSDREPGWGKDDIFSFTVEQGIKGVPPPKDQQVRIVVNDAKTGQPIQGAEIRILHPSGDGFVSGKQNLYEIDLQPVQHLDNTLNMQLIRRDAGKIGEPDLFANAAGEARYNFMQHRTYLLVASAPGYLPGDKFLTLDTNDDPTTLTIQLEESPICVPTNGTVATDQFGTRIANASLRFVHKITNRQETARTNLNGEFGACLPGPGEYLVQVEKEGFQPENITLTATKGKDNYTEFRLKPTLIPSGSEPTAAALIPLAGPLQEGTVIVMDKIYYDYNKATLNESATRHLNALCDLMRRYPEMEIELTSHTDTRGDAKANLALSQERATNAKKYMVYRGIEASRITALGKGESEPRNHCADGVNCSETEHQFNRRTEIRVRKIGGNMKVEYRDN
ncbi:MAG: carboxypeptidase regulatory-like domain-containing protein [Saprospiraceae bacterium]